MSTSNRGRERKGMNCQDIILNPLDKLQLKTHCITPEIIHTLPTHAYLELLYRCILALHMEAVLGAGYNGKLGYKQCI